MCGAATVHDLHSFFRTLSACCRAFTTRTMSCVASAIEDWTCREHSGHIQGTFREHSGIIQGTFGEHLEHIEGTCRSRSV
jgi:hypothetical protein